MSLRRGNKTVAFAIMEARTLELRIAAINEKSLIYMHLKFTKMQSLGNDFVVLDGVNNSISMTPAIAKYLADRHFGIGCDQILMAETDEQSDFRFRIFNQDGSEVEQCGNGARCFAIFLRDSGLTDKRTIKVQTINTFMELDILDTGNVKVNMGVPEMNPKNIPFAAESEAAEYTIDVAGQALDISAVSMGNPHSVCIVDDIDTAPVLSLGAALEQHDRFPARVNAGFMQVVSRHQIRLRVFERGVGETLGCGSGACAAVVAGILRDHLDSTVTVSLPGGDALVEWQGPGHPVFLSGPANHVFSGQIEIANHSLPQCTAA